MSSRTKVSQNALVRVIKYLCGSARLVDYFGWQLDQDMDLHCDTDYAGCLTTRRSTSGGVALRGHHLLKQWSSTESCHA